MGKLLEAIPFYDGSGQNDSLFRIHHFSSKCLPDSNNKVSKFKLCLYGKTLSIETN
jgi:hypothetical protein